MNFYEIKESGISLCMDHDVAYYHHFEVGEIICISNYYNPTLEYIINKTHKWNTKYKFETFSKNWSSTNHQKWTIPECVYQGYFKEVDKNIVLSGIRELRLKEIGI